MCSLCCKVHSDVSSRPAGSGTGMLLRPHLNISHCNLNMHIFTEKLFVEMGSDGLNCLFSDPRPIDAVRKDDIIVIVIG